MRGLFERIADTEKSSRSALAAVPILAAIVLGAVLQYFFDEGGVYRWIAYSLAIFGLVLCLLFVIWFVFAQLAVPRSIHSELREAARIGPSSELRLGENIGYAPDKFPTDPATLEDARVTLEEHHAVVIFGGVRNGKTAYATQLAQSIGGTTIQVESGNPSAEWHWGGFGHEPCIVFIENLGRRHQVSPTDWFEFQWRRRHRNNYIIVTVEDDPSYEPRILALVDYLTERFGRVELRDIAVRVGNDRLPLTLRAPVHFAIDRAPLVEQISNLFFVEQQRVVIVQGESGSGKTQLASIFANKHATRYGPNVYNLDCSTTEFFRESVDALAVRLAVDRSSIVNRRDLIFVVQERLKTWNEEILIVCEGVEDPTIVDTLVTTNSRVKLLTLTKHSAAEFHRSGRVLKVPELTEEECCVLARNLLNREVETDQIVASLKGTTRTPYNVVQVAESIGHQLGEVREPSPPGTIISEPLRTGITDSLVDRFVREQPEAAPFFQWLSLSHAPRFPLGLLLEYLGRPEAGTPFGDIKRVTIKEWIAKAKAAELVEGPNQFGVIQMHTLDQEKFRSRTTPTQALQYIEQIAHFLHMALTEPEKFSAGLVEREGIAAICAEFVRYVRTTESRPTKLFTVLWQLAEMEKDRSEYAAAAAWLELAVELGASVWQKNELQWAHFTLGVYYRRAAQLSAAEQQFLKSMSIETLDAKIDSLNQARCTDAIGVILRRQKQYKRALECHREAKSTLAAEGSHRDIVENMNNEALALRELGSLEEARTLLTLALDIDLQRKATLPMVDFRRTRDRELDNALKGEAKDRHNLGRVYRDFYKKDNNIEWLEKARDEFRQALEQDRLVYGEKSREVARGRHKLGRVLGELGDPKAAETEIRAAREFYVSYFGPNHPKSSQVNSDLNFWKSEVHRQSSFPIFEGVDSRFL